MKVLIFFEKFLPILFLGLIVFGFDKPYISILTLISALIHELGHFYAGKIVNSGTFSLPHAKITGFRIEQNKTSYKSELVVALGGPCINLIFGSVCFIATLFITPNEYLRVFGYINLLTMLSNLLLIEKYDGYRIVMCILNMLFNDSTRSEIILSRISFFLSVIITFFSLFLILKFNEGYWIFVVFFSNIVFSIDAKQKHTIFKK